MITAAGDPPAFWKDEDGRAGLSYGSMRSAWKTEGLKEVVGMNVRGSRGPGHHSLILSWRGRWNGSLMFKIEPWHEPDTATLDALGRAVARFLEVRFFLLEAVDV